MLETTKLNKRTLTVTFFVLINIWVCIKLHTGVFISQHVFYIGSQRVSFIGRSRCPRIGMCDVGAMYYKE